MTTSRTAMSTTGTHQNAPSATRAMRAPSTSTLSARGSRKAPELVLPCRRATQPSRASLPATAIQMARVSQAAPRSTISTITTGASRSRAAVRALAGVASAEGPNEPARRGPRTDDVVIGSRGLEVGTGRGDHGGREERADGPVVGHGNDAIDLGRLPMAASHADRIDEHVDLTADERRPLFGGDAILQLRELEETLGDEAAVDCRVEVGGVGPFFA